MSRGVGWLFFILETDDNLPINLEQRKVKLNPFVGNLRERLRLKPMPVNLVHDANGLPRIVLTEPMGSSAEPCGILGTRRPRLSQTWEMRITRTCCV
ncbi:hypothetical protein Ancab_026945 [Ancistrocladus abbreviatus]